MSVLNSAGASEGISQVQGAEKPSVLNVEDVHSTLLNHLEDLCKGKLENKINALHCDAHWLRYFYSFESRTPNWINATGLNARAQTFISMIAMADHTGLDPSTYHFREIISLIDDDYWLREVANTREQITSPLSVEEAAVMELLLTDAFFSYGLHLSEGRVDPDVHDPDWHIKKQKKNLADVYDRLLRHGEMSHFFEMLEPGHAGYLRLKQALTQYIRIREAGGWDAVPMGRTLRPGHRDKRVKAIKKRLMVSHDLAPEDNTGDALFDPPLAAAVKRFQRRHGLKPDGVVGKNTISVFNIPVEDRIARIRLNMERWRWLPESLGRSYVMVNTAGFQVHLVENDQTIKSMRAIVGKVDRPTPVMSDRITYMELNPYWNIPHAIAVKDILPKIQKNPAYLSRNKIRVFENWRNNAREINPEQIDWAEVNRYTFAFKLQQAPAKSNALGQVKFMFPNKFAVYLHDTPAHYLFGKTKRTFSSGCVRVEKPVELANYLLKDSERWNPENLEKTLESRERKIVPLKNPTNIHILYWTVWVEEDGMIHFRNDIYGKDRQLYTALNYQDKSYRLADLSEEEKGYLSSRKIHEGAMGM